MFFILVMSQCIRVEWKKEKEGSCELQMVMSAIRRSKAVKTADVAPFYLYKNVKLRINTNLLWYLVPGHIISSPVFCFDANSMTIL